MAKPKVEKIVDRLIIPVFKAIPPLLKIADYVAASVGKESYGYIKKQFIENGNSSQWNINVRQEIVKRFEKIDQDLPSATTATDGLFLAEALLSLEAKGDLIECGCYAGVSTAKISIIAKLLKKKLFVFDSFEGLPESEAYYKRDHHARRSKKWVNDWAAGKYASGLEQVKRHVELYGELSACTFIKGWFSETLTDKNLPEKISFAFTDVDLATSAEECLRAIYPRLTEKAVYFSHDVAYIKVLQAILHKSLWQEIFNAFPPILFGAGYGLSNHSPHLGFFVKGENVSPEYIKQLTVEK